jgi:hypothetical protein
MQRWKTILIVGVGVLVVAISIFMLCRIVQQNRWAEKSIEQLRQKGPPPTSLTAALSEDIWAADGYLIFTNGWAAFNSHTFHDSSFLGDVAVLAASDGSIYISHYHFCITFGEYRSRPRPKDIEEFIRLYGRIQSWKKISGS